METIIKKLLSVQSELKAPKSQYNSFGEFYYRNCEDILEAVKPLCAKDGLLLTLSDEIVFIDGRHYIKATATITDGNATVTTTAFAREEERKKGMDGSQITGAASSYARKYALNALFLIDDSKDSDTTNTHNKSNNDEQILDEWVDAVNSCNDLTSLNSLYRQNESTVAGNNYLIGLFKSRKEKLSSNVK